jgi:hypothetical protein
VSIHTHALCMYTAAWKASIRPRCCFLATPHQRRRAHLKVSMAYNCPQRHVKGQVERLQICVTRFPQQLLQGVLPLRTPRDVGSVVFAGAALDTVAPKYKLRLLRFESRCSGTLTLSHLMSELKGPGRSVLLCSGLTQSAAGGMYILTPPIACVSGGEHPHPLGGQRERLTHDRRLCGKTLRDETRQGGAIPR